MTDESLQAEVVRLRAELESARERELADLKAALAVAQQHAAGYRNESYRIAEVGRQLADEYERENRQLRARIDALTQAQTHAGSFARN